MTGAHYIERDPNRLGESVRVRLTWSVRNGERHVHERVEVSGRGVDDVFYPMDTEEGRARLALHCASPDMLSREESGFRSADVFDLTHGAA